MTEKKSSCCSVLLSFSVERNSTIPSTFCSWTLKKPERFCELPNVPESGHVWEKHLGHLPTPDSACLQFTWGCLVVLYAWNSLGFSLRIHILPPESLFQIHIKKSFSVRLVSLRSTFVFEGILGRMIQCSWVDVRTAGKPLTTLHGTIWKAVLLPPCNVSPSASTEDLNSIWAASSGPQNAARRQCHLWCDFWELSFSANHVRASVSAFSLQLAVGAHRG